MRLKKFIFSSFLAIRDTVKFLLFIRENMGMNYGCWGSQIHDSVLMFVCWFGDCWCSLRARQLWLHRMRSFMVRNLHLIFVICVTWNVYIGEEFKRLILVSPCSRTLHDYSIWMLDNLTETGQWWLHVVLMLWCVLHDIWSWLYWTYPCNLCLSTLNFIKTLFGII